MARVWPDGGVRKLVNEVRERGAATRGSIISSTRHHAPPQYKRPVEPYPGSMVHSPVARRRHWHQRQQCSHAKRGHNRCLPVVQPIGGVSSFMPYCLAA